MRKIFLSVMLLCGSSIGFAQLMEVGSTQKVNLPEGVKVDPTLNRQLQNY